MQRGPKPKPTKLALVQGNPGKRRLNQNEPEPPVGDIPIPAFLTPYAAEEWRRLVPMLIAAGLVAQVDHAALEGYCQAYGRWRLAEESVAGPPVVLGSNNVPKENPCIRVARTERKEMLRFAAELGLTPSARSRVERLPTGNFDERERHFA